MQCEPHKGAIVEKRMLLSDNSQNLGGCARISIPSTSQDASMTLGLKG